VDEKVSHEVLILTSSNIGDFQNSNIGDFQNSSRQEICNKANKAIGEN